MLGMPVSWEGLGVYSCGYQPFVEGYDHPNQAASNSAAIPWPPPMHMVSNP